MEEQEKGVSIIIDCPVAEVFKFVTDFSRYPRWQSFLVESKLTSAGPVRKGATYQYTFQFLGQQVETSGKITEFEPDRAFSFEADSGPFPIRGSFLFEAIDRYTRITAVGKIEPKGFFKTAESLLALLFVRQFESNLKTLRRLLEAPIH